MNKHGETAFYKQSREWSKDILKISGIEYKVFGLENIEKDKSYIFASNHASLMDIPVIIAAIPTDCNIMYKKELEKVPYWGKALIQSPYISVDRKNPVKAKQSLNESVERLDKGQSLIIFPEGTRSETSKVCEFKRGAFSVASVSKKPIIPVALKGTSGLMEKGSKKVSSGSVEVHFLNPVEISSSNKKEMLDFIDDMRNNISEIVTSY